MSEMLDQPMADGVDDESHLRLTEEEDRVLALYDKLQELRLEIAIINAQRALQVAAVDDGTPTEVETREAQSSLLETRAKYILRNNVVEAVMKANPILKAVHNGANASPLERDLLPSVERRDTSSIKVAQEAARSTRLWDDSTKVQADTLRASRDNVRLAAELFTLTEEAERKKMGRKDDSRTQDELEKSEREVKSSRQRWRVVKGVAAGVIAGSGIDWAGNDELRDIVLDPEIEE